ncbi:hypothetical protein ABH924_003738 [Arthrobacter sp. GAS37]|uniref:hypothetical protein n=1 Tax=Arthrobacter sp. GAS37 TaxID=3156261 RepID=UPI003836636E
MSTTENHHAVRGVIFRIVLAAMAAVLAFDTGFYAAQLIGVAYEQRYVFAAGAGSGLVIMMLWWATRRGLRRGNAPATTERTSR